MTVQEYLNNTSVYECQAIEILREQGKKPLLCKILHRDGDITWTVKTEAEAKKNIANYPADPRYHATTGYYNIIETIEINH